MPRIALEMHVPEPGCDAAHTNEPRPPCARTHHSLVSTRLWPPTLPLGRPCKILQLSRRSARGEAQQRRDVLVLGIGQAKYPFALVRHDAQNELTRAIDHQILEPP